MCVCMGVEGVRVYSQATVCLCMCACDKESLLSLHISEDLAQDPRHSWIWCLFWGVWLTSLFRHSWIDKTQQLGSDPLSRLDLVSLWACCENHDSHTKPWFKPGADNITLEVPLFPQDVRKLLTLWKFHSALQSKKKLYLTGIDTVWAWCSAVY